MHPRPRAALGALGLALGLGALGCSSQPYFVRTSTQRDTDIKFIVSNDADVFVVRCAWDQPGGALRDCRRLALKYDDR